MATAAILAGVVTWADASTPDSETQAFHGCVDNRHGTLRIIDPSSGATCKASERPISWNAAPSEGPELTIDGDQNLPGGAVATLRAQSDGPGAVREFTFQPNSIVSWHEDETLSWPPSDPPAVPPERSFAGATGRQVTIVAELSSDAPARPGGPPAGPLTPYLEPLRDLARPPLPFGDQEPPEVLLLWGPPLAGQAMLGVITELHIVHREMTAIGVPTATRVSLTLAEVRDVLSLTPDGADAAAGAAPSS